jgi:hypothetical protein
VFLRCHPSVVVDSEEVKEALRAWKEQSGRDGERVGELVGFVKGVMGWVGGVL